MIINFRVGNFRSFDGMQELSFAAKSRGGLGAAHEMAVPIKSVPMIAKTALLLGPNASGKSNLIKALSSFRTLVVGATSMDDAQFSRLYTPFEGHCPRAAATEFSIDLYLGATRYRYALSYISSRVTFEEIHVYRTGKSQRWFSRSYEVDAQREVWAAFSSSFHGPREMWRKATRPQATFLGVAVSLGCVQLKPLWNWFKTCIDLVPPLERPNWPVVLAKLKAPGRQIRTLKMLNSLGQEVSDLRGVEYPIFQQPVGTASHLAPSRHLQPAIEPLIEFSHRRLKGATSWVDGRFESAGLQRLVTLLVAFGEAIDEEKLLIVDEFDVRLHTSVAIALLRLLYEPTHAAIRTQVLLTTHNTALMDLKILNRNEIWLIDREAGQGSALRALSSIGVRASSSIAKQYLAGRFGALPIIQRS